MNDKIKGDCEACGDFRCPDCGECPCLRDSLRADLDRVSAELVAMTAERDAALARCVELERSLATEEKRCAAPNDMRIAENSAHRMARDELIAETHRWKAACAKSDDEAKSATSALAAANARRQLEAARAKAEALRKERDDAREDSAKSRYVIKMATDLHDHAIQQRDAAVKRAKELEGALRKARDEFGSIANEETVSDEAADRLGDALFDANVALARPEPEAKPDAATEAHCGNGPNCAICARAPKPDAALPYTLEEK